MTTTTMYDQERGYKLDHVGYIASQEQEQEEEEEEEEEEDDEEVPGPTKGKIKGISDRYHSLNYCYFL